MSKMSEMRPIERLSMLLLGIAILAFSILMGLRGCGSAPVATSVADRAAVLSDSLMPACGDTVIATPPSKAAKKKAVKKKPSQPKSKLKPYRRNHLDESSD